MKNKDLPQAALPTQKPFPGYTWPLIVAVAGFLLYINTVANGYVLDDSYAIQKNLFVQDGFAGIPKIFTVDFWYFANLKLGYYRPLSLVSFAIEHEFFGNTPGVGHFDNALLYGLSGFVLCLFLMQLFPKKNPAFAFLISLIFMAHPIHTEVVANIKSRDEILSFLNMIVTCYFAFRYLHTNTRKYLVWSLIFFYLGLISKETAVVGIILLPLFFYYAGQSVSASFKRLLPYAGVAALFFIQRKLILGDIPKPPIDLVNYPYAAGAVKLPSAFHIFELCLQKFILPWPLVYNYCYNQVPASHWADGGAIFGLLIFAVLAWFTFKELKKRSIWGLGLAIVFITLVPSLAFIFLRGGVMAERFLYAPALGFAVLLIHALSRIGAQATDEKAPLMAWAGKNKVLLAGALLLFLVYTVESVARNTAWKDELTLYATDAKYLSQNCQLHLHYGTTLLENDTSQKDPIKKRETFDLAVSELRKAIAIQPQYSNAYYELGFGYQLVETNLDSAIANYKKAIEINQNYAEAYLNLGVLYIGAGKAKLASYYFNKAAEANPLLPGAQYAENIKKSTGLDVHEFPGDEAGPVQQPGAPLPQQPSASAMPPANTITPEQAKEFDEAEKLGGAAVQKGDFKTALKYFKTAAAIQPNSRQNLIYLANTYGMMKNYPEAIKTFDLILKQDPDNQLVITNMAKTYEVMGEKQKAAELRKRLK